MVPDFGVDWSQEQLTHPLKPKLQELSDRPPSQSMPYLIEEGSISSSPNEFILDIVIRDY